MSDITYKKFSELTRVDSLQTSDIIPIAQFVSGTNYNSRSVPLSTLYNQTSAALITPFTTSIQTSVNSTLSSDKWNSTYSTVQTNSASWGVTITDTLTAFAQGATTTPQVVRFLSAGTTGNASVAIITTGTGSTLAQLPDNGTGGGNNRGNYATDWQKFRGSASQVASGLRSVVGGGVSNTASGTDSTVGGGNQNTASAQYSTVAGGISNTSSGIGADVGGGSSNRALSAYAVVGGGNSNTASGDYSIVAGGYTNTASGSASSIIGGINNNTNSKENAHIIGSNMTAPSANYTYVNNLSTPGTLRADSSTITKQYFQSYTQTYNGNAATFQPDFRIYSRYFYTFTGGTGTLTINVDGLIDVPGSEIVLYFRNTGASTRVVNILYQDSPGGGSYTNAILAVPPSSVGQASTNTFTLAATTGTAVVVMTNVNGQIIGYAV